MIEYQRGERARKPDASLIAAPETTAREETLLKGNTPFAGLVVANLSPAVAEELGLHRRSTGVVAADIKGGPARRIFRKGDVILEVNGVTIDSVETLQCASVSGDGLLGVRGQSRRPRAAPAARRLMSQSLPGRRAGKGRAAAARRSPAADDSYRRSSARIISSARTARSRACSPPGASRRSSSGGRPAPARPRSRDFSPARPGLVFEQMSAIFSGVADLKKAFEQARARREQGKGTLLFVDEIHRFNRAQQDSFLPGDGGRHHHARRRHDRESVLRAQWRASVAGPGSGAEPARRRRRSNCSSRAPKRTKARALPLDAEARSALIAMADGDGRYLLNLVEDIFGAVPKRGEPLDAARLAELVQKRVPLYDKSQDGHYNLISALHKSVRGSDPDATLYYLARMLTAGENPLFIARRLVRMAIEDIGLADPDALHQALAAKDTYDFLGSPEGELALAQAAIYLATAPKSNAGYVAFKQATRRAKETGSLAPPKIILNAPTRLMKEQEYGAGYEYDHDAPEAFSGQNYFPDAMGRETYYDPPDRGFEHEIRKRLDYWEKLRTGRKG